MAHKTTIEIFTPADNVPLPDESVVLAVEDEPGSFLWFSGLFDGDDWRLDDQSVLNQGLLCEKIVYWFYPPNPDQFASGG